MKPTILTFRLINSEINKYKNENKIADDSRAFLEFVLEKELEIERDDVVESVIDGSGDKGIDAIYIDEGSEDRPTIYLFQSKYYQSEEKFDRTFDGSALQKMQYAIENIILKSPETVYGANEFLLSKLRDIRAISNPRFEVVFCSNSSEPSHDAKNEFDSFIKEVAQGQDFFRVRYIDLKKLSDLITPVTSRKIDAKLKLSGQYFDWSLGEARVLVGRISGKEIAELCKKEGKDLFDRNVRGYLKKTNNVNKEIYKTATDQVEGSRFFFLNNGITIVCSTISYLPQRESPEVEISNIQIVNGGQTSNAIYEAYLSNLLSDSVYVLLKIVATEHRDLIEKITESTNTQTNVRARDLHSNDQIQKTIEAMLLNQGYYYETRKNKYKDTPAARGRRIDMEVAAQAYYAFLSQKPADAKNKKRKLFATGLYEEIFSSEDKQIAQGILLSFKSLEWVRKFHFSFKEKFSFVKYSEFHSIALLGRMGVKSVEDLSSTKTEKIYKEILEATAVVVEQENDRLNEEYSHRMLFIDPTTLGRITEVLRSKK